MFFDTVGIAWQYEAQGYECTYRLTLEPGTFPYLPDFWFPDLGQFGEVKGTLTHLQLTRLLNAAAYLSSAGGSGCHDNGGNDLVVLGNIPAAGHAMLPVILHMHKGDLQGSLWDGESDGCGLAYDTFATDYGGDPDIYDGHDPLEIASFLIRGMWPLSPDRPHYPDAVKTLAKFRPGYNAALSARFEYGQSGAPR